MFSKKAQPDATAAAPAPAEDARAESGAEDGKFPPGIPSEWFEPSKPLNIGFVPLDEEKVDKIVQDVLNLNLREMVAFTKKLETALDLPDVNQLMMNLSAGGGRGAGANTGGANDAKGEEEAPKEEEKTSFNLKLEGFGPSDKIKVIKLVREITGLGLKEAKDKVEGSPQVLLTDLTKEKGEEWVEKLKAAGGQAALE